MRCDVHTEHCHCPDDDDDDDNEISCHIFV